MKTWGPEHVTLAVVDPHDNDELVHFAYYLDPDGEQAETLCGQSFEPNAWRQVATSLVFPHEPDWPDVHRVPSDAPVCPTCSAKLPTG